MRATDQQAVLRSVRVRVRVRVSVDGYLSVLEGVVMLEGDTEGRVGIDARHADVEVARLGRAHQVLVDAQPLGGRVRVRVRVRVGVGGTLAPDR